MPDFLVMKDLVRQHGVRLTQQRAIILQALCELEGHASAEKVHERVTLYRRDVDLSTVYRTLERLRAIELSHAYLTPVAEAIRRDFDFEPILDHWAVFGLCQQCRERAET